MPHNATPSRNATHGHTAAPDKVRPNRTQVQIAALIGLTQGAEAFDASDRHDVPICADPRSHRLRQTICPLGVRALRFRGPPGPPPPPPGKKEGTR